MAISSFSTLVSPVVWLSLAFSAGVPAQEGDTPASPSRNLLENGGFEFAVGRGTAEGWRPGPPPGGSCGVDAAVAHSGQRSYRIVVPASARIDWYMTARPASGFRRGATYTVSAWLRPENVCDGAGAYISLSCFDSNGKRLAFQDSPEKALGTGDWRRHSATCTVADGTTELRAVLCVHGHGTAWFDDVQVEEGTRPTPFQPAAADAARSAQLQEQQRLAAAWLHDLPARAPDQARVGILELDGALPASERAASAPAVLEEALRAAGHAAVRITPEQLANEACLDPTHIDLLVLPYGDLFPAPAHRALVSYLSRGGALLSMGGYAFDRPVVQADGVWQDPDALPVGNLPATALFTRGFADWHPSTNRAEPPELSPATGPAGEPALQIHTPALEGWDTAVSPNVAGTLPAGWSVTRLWARGDGRTPSMWVEWAELDGSRWHKAIPLTQDWQEVVIPAAALTYWHDSSSVGRGGATDHFNPAQARQLQVGVAVDIVAKGQPHSVWVAGVRVQADAAGDLRQLSPRINTRWAPIRDCLLVTPEQIGVFDPGFRLENVASARTAPEPVVAGEFAWTGALDGYSAVGMLGLNGHGFGPNRARWLPLVECLDALGRHRGHAGAVVHHYEGTFAGSSWGVFGVTNVDLFAAGSPALESVLRPTVEYLLRRVYLHETDTAYATYRAGETARLRTRVSNVGPRAVSGSVRFSLRGGGRDGAVLTTLSQPVEIRPGATLDVQSPWPVPVGAPDLVHVTADLCAGERILDREANGFVVWTPAVLAAGPKLSRDGTRLRIAGRPQFLMGSQTYWGQNGSVTARSPLAFDRDYRQMRDHGLTWTRCFVPFKTEEDKRISDAMVQLAQKHGLIFYHTPNLHNTADPAELAQQAAVAREIAERYREVPGLAIDICNEPVFRADDAGLAKRLGGPVRSTGPWEDLAVAAGWRGMAEAQRAWAAGNREAVRGADPARLVSVGWSQGWAGGGSMKDPILASLDLDFTDRHYYGNPAGLPPELKDLDLRLLGKPLTLGECGAKDHPTFKAVDPWHMGDDHEAYDRRFLSLGHHAFGLGAAAMSSWHWRDPMEGVFPCGLTHQTGAPRPTAAVYRAMALAFGRLRPANASPPVCLLLPDAGRMSGQRETMIRACHRAAELLVASRVDFGLLPDSACEDLPATVKAVIYPLPLDPADTVVTWLERFARGGGAVLISGDLSYDAQRQPTQRARLRRLCGVDTAATPVGPPWVRAAAVTLVPAAASGLPAAEACPVLTLRSAGAEVLGDSAAGPVITRKALGSGQVWFSADPLELAPELTPLPLALYRAFLDAAKVPALAVAPDTPDLQVFRVRGEDADALVLRQSAGALTAQVGDLAVDLAEGGTGFALVSHEGAVRALEAQGAVRVGQREVARIRGHAFVVSTDDRDLAESRQWLVLALAPGEVRVGSAARAVRAEICELRHGTWVALGPASATVASGEVVVPIPAALRREIIRVTRLE